MTARAVALPFALAGLALILNVIRLPRRPAPRPDPRPTELSGCGLPALDRFGGLRRAVAPRRRFFRVVRLGARWIFLTPRGDPFWLLGVFNVQPPDRRFGAAGVPNAAAWGIATARQLRAWGFNTAAEYSSPWVEPVSRYGARNHHDPLPFVDLLRPEWYSLANRHHYAPGPVKNLVAGLDAEYHNYRGDPLPDVFDPNFAIYANRQAEAETSPALAASPWLIGTAIGDTDSLWGFGPGGALPTHPAGKSSSNIGWIALCTNFRQTGNAALGVRYRNSRVFTKYALARWLRHRYGTIQALDRAWHAAYTSFGDNGGYGRGTGLLDEDGRDPWVGRDDVNLATAKPAVRADLNAFLRKFADRYFAVTAAAVRRFRPGHLVFGPATLNGWHGLTRPQILAAAAQYDDVVQASFGSAQVYRRTLRAAPNRPFVTWMGFTANANSELAAYARPGAGGFPTQAARGAAYAAQLRRDFDRPHVAGAKLWDWADSWGEKANWGLVSLVGRPYGPSHPCPIATATPTATGLRGKGPTAPPRRAIAAGFTGAVAAANRSLLWAFRREMRTIQALAHGR